MTTTAPAPPLVLAGPPDPRLGALLGIAQRMIAAYADLARSLAPELSEGMQADLVHHVRLLVGEATAGIAEVAAQRVETAAARIAEYAARPGIDDGQRQTLRTAERIASGERL